MSTVTVNSVSRSIPSRHTSRSNPHSSRRSRRPSGRRASPRRGATPVGSRAKSSWIIPSFRQTFSPRRSGRARTLPRRRRVRSARSSPGGGRGRRGGVHRSEGRKRGPGRSEGHARTRPRAGGEGPRTGVAGEPSVHSPRPLPSDREPFVLNEVGSCKAFVVGRFGRSNADNQGPCDRSRSGPHPSPVAASSRPRDPRIGETDRPNRPTTNVV